MGGGNQQKMVLAAHLQQCGHFRARRAYPGIDVGAKLKSTTLAQPEGQQSVILISSELPEIVSLCDRVYVMFQGSVVAEYAGDEITQENIMRSACFHKEDEPA